MMIAHQVEGFKKTVEVLSKALPGEYIGEENAGVFNAILEEAKKKAPADPVIASLPRARKETRWQNLAGMISVVSSTLDGVARAESDAVWAEATEASRDDADYLAL